MKQKLLFIILTVCLSGILFAQEKDTVYVEGFYTAGEYGTLTKFLNWILMRFMF
jgi:hypothetical protein